ncbi:MAG: thiol-disulfide oxidoreductase DCC family protein [Xanthomonadaceae bacterium]|nr:thiol-disulfide oxidoreductase DCC family protein [Xanthomonadaceae bacterium]
MNGAQHPSPATGAVIVFDGVCVLCNGWVRFLLKHDRRKRYRFAAMQDAAGRRLLAENGLDPDDPVSFLLIEYDIESDHGASPRVSTDTTAIRRVIAGLGGLWRVARLAALLPGFVRDPLYRLVARNRYRLFGKHDACMVPAPEERVRFL